MKKGSAECEQKWKVGAEKGTAGLHATGCTAISDKLVTKEQGNGRKPHKNCDTPTRGKRMLRVPWTADTPIDERG